MTAVEQLQAQYTLVMRRIAKLEEIVWLLQRTGKDAGAAAAVATELKLEATILVQCDKVGPRRTLARELHKRGWGHEKIGKVMNCSEKTVRRYCSSGLPGQGHLPGEGNAALIRGELGL